MRKEEIPEKTRTMQVDPNLPKWVCQNCHNSLTVVGVDSYAGKFFNDSPHSAMQGSSIHGGNSVLGSTRMDNSFVVLPRQKPHASQGIPPRPRATPSSQPSDTNQSVKAMEESFVVVYKSEPASDPGVPLHSNTSSFNASINVLTRAFDIARTQTQIEQPLCLECMRVLSDKLEKEVEDVTRDLEAYEACVQRLEGETQDALSEADFLKEKKKIEEEERKLVAAIEETEKQNAEVSHQLKELESKGKRFNELEDRYWQEFNNFQFQLIAHQVRCGPSPDYGRRPSPDYGRRPSPDYGRPRSPGYDRYNGPAAERRRSPDYGRRSSDYGRPRSPAYDRYRSRSPVPRGRP